MAQVQKFPVWVVDEMQRLSQIASLFEQVITYKRPGTFELTNNYPQEIRTWNEIAERFEASGIYPLQRIGYRMAKLINAIEDVDRTVREGGKLRKKGVELKRQGEAFARSLKAVEHYVV